MRVAEPLARKRRDAPDEHRRFDARRPANPAAQGRPAFARAPFRASGAEVEEAGEIPDAPEVELVPGSLAEELRAPLAVHLAGGSVVVIAAGVAPDPLAQDPYDHVPVDLATDGTWTWDLAWRHWVHEHGCAPPAEFVAHARARGFAPPPAVTG
ncbi:hypothetical protein PV364_04060 [Streptomyces sp. MI02-7b]|nr:hypothetical protein [Streptomyces sp. MI02-7b]